MGSRNCAFSKSLACVVLEITSKMGPIGALAWGSSGTTLSVCPLGTSVFTSSVCCVMVVSGGFCTTAVGCRWGSDVVLASSSTKNRVFLKKLSSSSFLSFPLTTVVVYTVVVFGTACVGGTFVLSILGDALPPGILGVPSIFGSVLFVVFDSSCILPV